MATKSEAFRASEQRRGRGAKTRPGRTKPGVAPEERSQDKEHAAKKATYALEVSATTSERPSRKSTRKSANRSKTDAALTSREALQKGTPEQRYRKAHAQGKDKTAPA